MKTKLFSFLIALTTSVGTIFAERVQIGDLYYNLDAGNLTAEVTYQERWSENNYSGLTSADIPSSVTYNSQTYSVTSIGDDAFYNCRSLTSIVIPNSVTSIGGEAFYECSSLTSVTIPNSVTSIGYEAFEGCSSLTSVTIPSSVTSIRYAAFRNCTSLTSVTIPNSVTSIGDDAFYNCRSLTSVTIGNSVTSIGDDAFYNCRSLTSVTIPSSVTSIGDWTFASCSGLTSVTIPNSVTSMGYAAFYNCIGLTSVTIPNSVTSIGQSAFSWCTSLTSIIVESGNSMYDSRDNCNAIIETSTNTLIAGCQNTVIPNSVTSIGQSAFSECSSLTSIDIPSSVTSIGEYAFYGCSSLISVYNYATTPQAINSNVFYELNLSTCTLYVPEESIELYRAADVWKDFGNIIAIPGTEAETEEYNINYLNKSGDVIDSELVTLTLPAAPEIEGFTFLRWDVVAGQLADGISIQAVYTADTPTAAPVVVNPANKAQKLIRNGNVYILTGTKTYNALGAVVK